MLTVTLSPRKLFEGKAWYSMIKNTKPLSKIRIWVRISKISSEYERFVESGTLKRVSIGYSEDAYSFQCGMQLLIWGENMIALVVGLVGECCSQPS